MSREKRITILVQIVLVGFCFAVFYHYVYGVYLGIGYPYNTFLFVPIDRFSDFYRVLQANQDLNPYFGTYRMFQYPLLNFMGFIFSLIPFPYSFLLFILIVTGFMLVACSYSLAISGRPTNWTNIFVLSTLTYPFLIDIDRGNFDGIIFALLVLFIYFFSKEKYIFSAVFLSFAMAMKPFPVVLLLLFVSRRKIKEAIIAVSLTVAASVVSLLLFKGGFFANLSAAISISSFPDAIGASGYFLQNNFVFHSVSLFAILKVYFIESGQIQNIDMSLFSSMYIKGVLLALVPISTYVVFFEKQLWRQVAILSIVMVVFPQISGGYRLLYMFIPLFLFFRNEQTSRGDYLYTVLFGLLLIPKSYYFFPKTITDAGVFDFSIAYPVDLFIMVIMLLVIIIAGISKNTGNISLKKITSDVNSLVRNKGA